MSWADAADEEDEGVYSESKLRGFEKSPAELHEELDSLKKVGEDLRVKLANGNPSQVARIRDIRDQMEQVRNDTEAKKKEIAEAEAKAHTKPGTQRRLRRRSSSGSPMESSKPSTKAASPKCTTATNTNTNTNTNASTSLSLKEVRTQLTVIANGMSSNPEVVKEGVEKALQFKGGAFVKSLTATSMKKMGPFLMKKCMNLESQKSQEQQEQQEQQQQKKNMNKNKKTAASSSGKVAGAAGAGAPFPNETKVAATPTQQKASTQTTANKTSTTFGTDDVRTRFLAMANALCNDSAVVKRAVDDAMNFKGGMFVKSLTDANVDKLGHNLVNKFINKTIATLKATKTARTPKTPKIIVGSQDTMRAKLTEIARTKTNDPPAVNGAVDHVMSLKDGITRTQRLLNNPTAKTRADVIELMQPVLDAHRNAKKNSKAGRRALEAAAKERKAADQRGGQKKQTAQEAAAKERARQQKNQAALQQQQRAVTDDRAAQARMFARAQAAANKAKADAAKSTPILVKLSLMEVEKKLTDIANEMCNDSSIVKKSVEKAMQFKDGVFAMSLTAATMKTHGQSLMKKYVNIAVKSKRTLPQNNKTNPLATHQQPDQHTQFSLPQPLQETKTTLPAWEMAARREESEERDRQQFEAAQQEFMEEQAFLNDDADDVWYPPDNEDQGGEVWYPPQQQQQQKQPQQPQMQVIQQNQKQEEIQQQMQEYVNYTPETKEPPRLPASHERELTDEDINRYHEVIANTTPPFQFAPIPALVSAGHPSTPKSFTPTSTSPTFTPTSIPITPTATTMTASLATLTPVTPGGTAGEYDSVKWLRVKLDAGHITDECFHDIVSTFHEQKIRTMFQVKMLNQEFLISMGIVALGHQIVLLSAIDEYKLEEQHELMTRANYLFDHDDEDGDDFFD